jgi:exosome complex component RRP41
MSESRTKLEQILELLLAEDNTKAEEMLHEYVVSKARAEYERVLDESEEEVEETVDSEDEEAVEETIDQSNDFEDDILADETEIESDEAGFNEGEDEEGEEGEEAGEEGEEDLEDKVDDLEAELEDLRAEFEKLMSGDEGDMDDADMADMEAGDEDMMGDEDEMMDSVEYDLDEEVEDGEVVEEATKLQNSVAAPKAPAADASNGTSPVAKHKAGWETGAPVKAKDGSAGNAGANKAKDHTPTNNIGLKPAKVNVPKA